jgi:hypothetical protein
MHIETEFFSKTRSLILSLNNYEFNFLRFVIPSLHSGQALNEVKDLFCSMKREPSLRSE